jgi:hypothetical protein
LGDRFGTAWSLHELLLVETTTGRLDAARAHAREAMEMFREDGDLEGMNMMLVNFASIDDAADDRPRALRLAAAAIAVSQRFGILLASQSWTSPPFPFVPWEPADLAERAWWDEGSRIELEEAVRFALESPERRGSG